jgi:thiol-disulfide isomerase/thioredoxin
MAKPFFVGQFMQKVLFATLVFTIQLLASSAVFAIEREISWTEDYEAAVQRAATTNSIVLLHFYGDYCPPCKLLDKKTFHDPALVSTMNEHLVAVKVNADRRRDLAQKYQVTRWPTDVYLFPNGDEIYRGVSNADPSVYCKTIERVALRHRDWTVERNAMAQVTERRQDKALAARTPQIQSEKPVYAGNAGYPVRTQAAAWSQQVEQQKPVASSGVLPSASLPNSRVIENPYITQQPIIVPPAAATQPPVVSRHVPAASQNPIVIPNSACNQSFSELEVIDIQGKLVYKAKISDYL